MSKLRNIIGEFAGFSSMCWNPKPTGEFDSSLASSETEKVEKAILAWVREELVPEALNPSIKGYSHDRTQMNVGWNNCRTQILNKLTQMEKE